MRVHHNFGVFYSILLIHVGTYRPDVAFEVMTENKQSIIEAKLNHQLLANKLLEKKIINSTEKDEVTDEHSGRTADQRMDKLLGFLIASIKTDGEDFGVFLEILKKEDTKRFTKLADRLLADYIIKC